MTVAADIATLLATNSAGAVTAANIRQVLTEMLTLAGNSFNVINYGAKGDGATDDSAAFIAAINAMNTALTNGTPAKLIVPPGIYRIVSSLPMFIRGGYVEGDGIFKSIIKVDINYSGDLFSWSETWAASAWYANNVVILANNVTGAGITGIGITGDISSSHIQNALMFYDRNERVVIRDVQVDHLNGRALAIGLTSATSVGFLRESHIINFRSHYCGNNTSTPIIDINATGSISDSTNELTFYDVNVFAARGPGMAIRNGSTNSPVRNLRFYNLRIEGDSTPPSLLSDLLTIGDTTLAQGVQDIQFFNLQLGAPYSGKYGLTFIAPNATAANLIQSISIRGGSIGPGPGKGINIQAGRSLLFNISNISVTDTNVTVGPNTSVGAPIVFNQEYGIAGLWTWAIDATSHAQLRSFVPIIGSPATGGVALGLTATGSASFDALVLTEYKNEFTTVAAGTGARLPTPSIAAGLPQPTIVVANKGANALKVYPNFGQQINGAGADIPYSIAINTTVRFEAFSSSVWYA